MALVALLIAVTGLVACSGGSDDDPGPVIDGTGVTWVSGANANHPEDTELWREFTGRDVDLAMMFVTRSSWDTVVSPEWPLNAYTPDKWPGQFSVAVPMWPVQDGQYPLGNERECAAGEYDEYWAEFGRNLQKYGRGDAIVRLGWEFNGNWFKWYPEDSETWEECFRREVTAIRSTAPDVQIDWTMTMGRDEMPNGDNVWAAYPGDEYVDIIGIDYYDMYPPKPTQETWNRTCVKPSGLCTVVKEARARGKKFSVPEWGVVSGEGGGGDNPFFIEKMYEIFHANADILAYEVYYNNAEEGNVRSSLVGPVLNPKSAKRYQELFGAG
ncbi:glycoside hydrolase family 26 protein [Frankia nepalensis]|uniref:glycoside hydrolase family 26 protein n=1 Tax=Frankia nepalensis TaxID=1836974 RepID=UPI0027DC7BA5|nr:glycosyl hydrolase [Frankia nepalensis]